MFHQCWPLWWPFPGSAHCWEPEGVCELFIQLSVCLFVWTACKYLSRYSPPAIQDIPSGSDQASPSSTWRSWSRSRSWKGNAPPKSYSYSCNLQFARGKSNFKNVVFSTQERPNFSPRTVEGTFQWFREAHSLWSGCPGRWNEFKNRIWMNYDDGWLLFL